MKIRIGFVSNSSSSSFILAFNGTKPQLKKKLEKVFGMNIPNYPIKSIGEGIPECFMNNLGEEITSEKKFGEYWELDDLSEDQEKALKCLKSGWKVYAGGFDDQSDALDNFLCNSDIEYEDDELFIYQGGGY